mmetsp:Transcript_13619/g.30037  ORF Transcript_13619/g.30037 Transcript_13619/m.30037 type:complete len:239 (-) Transcript_13619:201-917(-)
MLEKAANIKKRKVVNKQASNSTSRKMKAPSPDLSHKASLPRDRKHINLSYNGRFYEKASSRRDRHRIALMANSERDCATPLKRGGARGPGSLSLLREEKEDEDAHLRYIMGSDSSKRSYCRAQTSSELSNKASLTWNKNLTKSSYHRGANKVGSSRGEWHSTALVMPSERDCVVPLQRGGGLSRTSSSVIRKKKRKTDESLGAILGNGPPKRGISRARQVLYPNGSAAIPKKSTRTKY